MIIKTVKIVLFVSLIAAMILPFYGMNFADAKNDIQTQKELDELFEKVSDVYSDDYLNYVKNIISKLGVTESSKTLDNGDVVHQNIVVSKHGKDSYKVTDSVKINTVSDKTQESKVTYFVTVLEDGTLNITVPDAKSSKQDKKGLEYNLHPESASLIPQADALTGTLRLTASQTKTIKNNHIDFSASTTQNCGLIGASTMKMFGSADAITIGQYWRSINAKAIDALIWRDLCIIPHSYTGMVLTMAGTSYSNSVESVAINPGWGPTNGLQFPWDDLTWKAQAYYKKI